MPHIDERDRELAANHVPRWRRTGVGTTGRQRIPGKRERTRLGQFDRVLLTRLHFDSVARRARAVTHGAPRLNHDIWDRTMKREVFVERPRDDSRRGWLAPIRSPAAKPHEKCRGVWGPLWVHVAVNATLVGLDDDRYRTRGNEPSERRLDRRWLQAPAALAATDRHAKRGNNDYKPTPGVRFGKNDIVAHAYLLSEDIMTEHLILRRWLCVLPLLSLGIACGGKMSDPGAGTIGGSSAAVGGAAAVGGSAGTGGTVGDYAACNQDSDCAWTEISIEILKPSDCMCLYGCPYVPVNMQTAQRRAQQYSANCDARHDGKGVLCGIDDCMLPPALFCLDGTCSGPQK